MSLYRVSSSARLIPRFAAAACRLSAVISVPLLPLVVVGRPRELHRLRDLLLTERAPSHVGEHRREVFPGIVWVHSKGTYPVRWTFSTSRANGPRPRLQQERSRKTVRVSHMQRTDEGVPQPVVRLNLGQLARETVSGHVPLIQSAAKYCDGRSLWTVCPTAREVSC